MKAALFAPLIALLLATPARAERLLFDHGLYPALKASLDAKRDDTIFYDDSNPKYVFDRILVHGNSQQDWSEALEIIARTRSREVHSAQDWYRAIISDRQAPCPAQFTVIGQDSTSITFARQSRDCPAGTPSIGLYRIVEGKRSIYLLNALSTRELDATAREQWLRLLASARLAG